jgi:hypothetical protein
MTERLLANGHILDACLCVSCAELRDLEAATPPNPYAAVTPLRAVEPTFEQEWKASRHPDHEAEHARTAAHLDANPSPRLTAAETEPYAPPNPYAAGIKALQEKP